MINFRRVEYWKRSRATGQAEPNALVQIVKKVDHDWDFIVIEWIIELNDSSVQMRRIDRWMNTLHSFVQSNRCSIAKQLIYRLNKIFFQF